MRAEAKLFDIWRGGICLVYCMCKSGLLLKNRCYCYAYTKHMKDKCKMVNCRNALHNSKRKINLNVFSRKWDSPFLLFANALHYSMYISLQFFYPFVSNTKVLFKLNNGSVFYTVNCYVLEMEDFLDKRKYKSGTQSKNISDHLKSSLLKKFAAFCDCLRLT